MRMRLCVYVRAYECVRMCSLCALCLGLSACVFVCFYNICVVLCACVV